MYVHFTLIKYMIYSFYYYIVLFNKYSHFEVLFIYLCIIFKLFIILLTLQNQIKP